MAAAAVIAAIVTLAMVMLSMVVALDIGVVIQLSCQEGFHRSIRISGYTAVELDSRCCQRHLGTAADAAANQHLCLQGLQHACQCAMAAAVGIHHRGGDYLAVLHIIDLKQLGVSKVLEYWMSIFD